MAGWTRHAWGNRVEYDVARVLEDVHTLVRERSLFTLQTPAPANGNQCLLPR